MPDEHIVTEDGCRLWSAQSGSGPRLVLTHGGPGLWDYFGDLAELLGDAARVVRWDQRGCGRSERRGPYTVSRFVADLGAIAGPAPVALLGHSWGATLALRYALTFPTRVSALIYVAGTGIDAGDPWRQEFHAAMERLAPGVNGYDRESAIRSWTADFVDPSTARARAERMATPWFGVNEKCAAAIKADNDYWLSTTDVHALCRNLTIPTTIIDGAHDLRPRWAVDSLAAALPNAHRVVLPDSGHLPWVESPGPFHKAVIQALTTT